MYNKSHIFKTKFTNYLYDPQIITIIQIVIMNISVTPKFPPALFVVCLFSFPPIPIHQPHPQAISDPVSVDGLVRSVSKFYIKKILCMYSLLDDFFPST